MNNRSLQGVNEDWVNFTATQYMNSFHSTIKDSEPVSVTVYVQDTTEPSIIIHSPENRVYKISKENPLLNYEISDIGGISEEAATLNDLPIANGSAIKLVDFLGKNQNLLKVFAQDPSNNEGTAEVIFSIENSSFEIRKVIDNAVKEYKIRRSFARWIKLKLYLYDYFMDRADFFENKGKVCFAKFFRKMVEKTLIQIIRKIKRKSRWVDPEVKELLIILIEDLKG